MNSVFSFLNTPHDLSECSSVCRRWNRISDDDLLWRRLCAIDYPQLYLEKENAKKKDSTWKVIYKGQYEKEQKWKKYASLPNTLLDINTFPKVCIFTCICINI